MRIFTDLFGIARGVRRTKLLDTVLQWGGTGTGLLGAFLVSLRSPISDWGFIAFLCSNLLLIAFFIRRRLLGMIVLQLGFCITSIMGIWNGF